MNLSQLFKKRKINIFLVFPLVMFCLGLNFSNAQSCTINAGLDRTICVNDVFQLDGTSPDTYASGPIWRQISGPSVSISDQLLDDPIITGAIAGNTYVFELSAECFNGDTPSQTVTFSVDPITIADAGSDIASCPDSSGSLFISGNSGGVGETGVWTIEGNNGAGVTINQPNSETSTINLATTSAGNTTLRWTLSGGGCTSFDEITVTNYGGVTTIDAGAPDVLPNCYSISQSTNLAGSFAGIGGNGQIGTWTVISGPNTPTIDDENDNNTAISDLIEATYESR